MRTLLVTVMMLLGLVATPLASAGEGLPLTVCGLLEDVAGDEAACEGVDPAFETTYLGLCATFWLLTGPREECGSLGPYEIDGEAYYVGVGPWGLFREENGCAGLQPEPSDCDGDGASDPADDSLTLGELTGL